MGEMRDGGRRHRAHQLHIDAGRAVWTPERIAQLRGLYATRSAQECADLMGLTYQQIVQGVKRGGLRKSREWIVEPASDRPIDVAAADLVRRQLKALSFDRVTASLLDVAGGMIVAASCIDELEDFSPSYLKERFSRLGTIDLRIDYLRPGRGNEFIATAHIIRAGSKVAVARMELHNEEGTHIAFGTGTYLVG